MQRTTKAREEFIEVLLSHLPETIPGFRSKRAGELAQDGVWSWFWDGRPFAKRLMRYGATLGRIAENQCNGYQDWKGNWDERASLRDEKKEERIQAKVTELCAEFGCKPVFQGDPRGNTLKIVVPDGYTNDWGREGVCVPTS